MPRLRIFAILLLILTQTSCGIYSLKSGSVPIEVQSIVIDNVYNESGGGPPNMGQLFTEKLKTYYQQNSRLSIVKSGGEWQLESKIVGYQTSPVAPVGGSENQSSAYNRLTIRVQVKFTSTVDEKSNFDQTFSFFADYEQNQTLSQKENELIDVISTQIVQDIFNKTTSTW